LLSCLSDQRYQSHQDASLAVNLRQRWSFSEDARASINMNETVWLVQLVYVAEVKVSRRRRATLLVSSACSSVYDTSFL